MGTKISHPYPVNDPNNIFHYQFSFTLPQFNNCKHICNIGNYILFHLQ